ncbi:MAG: hypothetical protein JWO03_1294 [Bacteroidetes bacterium]|nr:hypothetical protein [Bacteroidota bacterium]
MAIDVCLTDENGNPESNLVIWETFKGDTSIEAYVLLKYIDPHGDTTFNTLQIADLISDMIRFKKTESCPAADAIIELANRCRNEVHTYLVFYGD